MSDVDKSSATPHTEDTSGPQTSDMPGVEPVLVADMDEEPTTAGVGKPASEIVGRSPMQLAWLRLKRDRTAKVTGALIVLMLVAAYGAPLWALVYGYDAYDQNPDKLDGSAIPLGVLGGVSSEHWLGVVPGNGQDVLMTLLYGIRTSVSIAIVSAIVVVAIGAVIGAVSGYVGGWVDAVISWFIDVMLSFPFLIFALAIVPIVTNLILGGPGARPLWLSSTMLIVTFMVFFWMNTARLVRGQVLSLREREFVEAARASGAGLGHIVFKQLLPNVWAPILVSFSLMVPALVASEAYLAFLGIGVGEPHPDLGRLVSLAVGGVKAQQVGAWFLMMLSGGTILLLVLTFNMFGDAVRDALNPKSHK
ncbi:peptide/nickel transport system permease protein [Stackebrandtia albiflava]|uniref:Peptide/nickel transport system permease protein n=1 Tax=Stackebrandtia albiflava TaxID=406432 RepID=A0A562UPR8_9ACTN|nr:ABC transporter permease [Stackebrandtia albiflava]TWJ07615.1 peptide/nickel transport system permease protein [Stackebrandtia albiflava]